MNDYMNDINNIDESGQLALFTETEDSVEDLIYEFLRDRGASTERAYYRDLKHFFNFTGAQFGLPKVEGIRFMSYVGKGQKMNRVPHPFYNTILS